MPEKAKTEIVVISTLMVNVTMMIVGKLISGDIYGSADLSAHFTCTETGGKWKLAALGFLNPRELDDNIRSFGLEHVEGNAHLEKGFTLVSI